MESLLTKIDSITLALEYVAWAIMTGALLGVCFGILAYPIVTALG